MKYGIVVTLCAVVAFTHVRALASDVGNGGFGLKCGNHYEVLDLYELREVHKLTLDLGGDQLTYIDKVDIMLDRMARWMPDNAAILRDKAHKFFKDYATILGNRTVFVGNESALSEGKRPPLDLGNTIIPNNCDIVAMARGVSAASSPTAKPHIFIFSEPWRRMNADSQAALVLHELIYQSHLNSHRYPKIESSLRVRHLVAHLAAAEFEEMSYKDFYELVRFRGLGLDFDTYVILDHLEYKSARFNSGVNFHQSGFPSEIAGIYQIAMPNAELNLKTPVGAKSYTLEPRESPYLGYMYLTEDGIPRSGILQPDLIGSSPQDSTLSLTKESTFKINYSKAKNANATSDTRIVFNVKEGVVESLSFSSGEDQLIDGVVSTSTGQWRVGRFQSYSRDYHSDLVPKIFRDIASSKSTAKFYDRIGYLGTPISKDEVLKALGFGPRLSTNLYLVWDSHAELLGAVDNKSVLQMGLFQNFEWSDVQRGDAEVGYAMTLQRDGSFLVSSRYTHGDSGRVSTKGTANVSSGLEKWLSYKLGRGQRRKFTSDNDFSEFNIENILTKPGSSRQCMTVSSANFQLVNNKSISQTLPFVIEFLGGNKESYVGKVTLTLDDKGRPLNEGCQFKN